MLFTSFKLVIATMLFLSLVSITSARSQSLCLKDHLFIADMALTQEEKLKGLMGRESLSDTDAMLFAQNAPQRTSFWMKNMLMSIDIIYFDSNFKLLKLFSEVPPCEKKPCKRYVSDSDKVKYILEIRSGLAKELNLVKADLLKIHFGQKKQCLQP